MSGSAGIGISIQRQETMTKAAFYSRQEPSLTVAWANAFLRLNGHATCELAPFTMSAESASGLSIPDSLADPLVQALDASLEKDGHQSVEKVASTIFPERLWKLCHGDRQELYREYIASLRSYVKWEPRKNQRGIYFARLIGFGIDHKTGQMLGYEPTVALNAEGNQLEHIIRQCKKSVAQGRKAARMQLQGAVFDPFRDLTTESRPSFPCLQHIAFDLEIASGGLALSAFYATQQLFVKAYGNWVGLCRLGAFVAGQVGLKLTRFTCFAGVEKMGIAPKNQLLRSQLVCAAREAIRLVGIQQPEVNRHAC
jgi:hypothetical protein